MVSMNAMVGLPVICAGKKLGRVERGILDKSGKTLLGMIVRKGIGGAKWINSTNICTIGGIAVLVRTKAERLPKEAEFSLTTVKDTTGLRLGTVTDVLLSPLSLRVAALEVSLGLVDDWLHGRYLVRDFVVRPVRQPSGRLTPQEGEALIPCGLLFPS